MFTSPRMLALVAATAAALLAAPLAADITDNMKPAPSGGITIYPREVGTEQQRFLSETFEFCALEQQMGELALQKSSREPIQIYARLMLSSQARRQRELAGLAQDAHISLPKATGLDVNTLARLAKLQGAEFDRAYINTTLSNHQAAVASLQIEGTGGIPRGAVLAPVVDWANRNIAGLNDELAQAQTILQSLGAVTSAVPASDLP